MTRELPDGWTWVKLGDVARKVRNTVKDHAEEGIEWAVRGEDFESGSLRLGGRTPVEQVGPTFVKRFEPGHVLFPTRRAYLRKVAEADFTGVVANTTEVLEAKPERLFPGLFPFIIQSDAFVDYAVEMSVGSTNPYVKWTDLKRFEMPLPPMGRQRELVEVFRGVEDVIIQQEDALDAAKRLVRSVRNDLFSPKPGWRAVRLGEIAEVQLGKMLSPAAKTGEHYRPYLRAANIKRGEIDFSDLLEMDFDPKDFAKFVLQPGDILLAEGNANPAYLGDPSLYTEAMPKGMCFQKTMVRVRTESDDALASFVYHALRYLYETGVFLGIARGTDMKHITAIRTSKLKMSLPSTESQWKIVDQMTALESTVNGLRQHAERTQRLKRSLLTTELSPANELVELA